MTSPAANTPQATSGITAFHNLVDQVMRHAVAHETADYALKLGVIPDQVIGFVRGTLQVATREEVIHQVATIPWVAGRVVALMKARRNPNSLGARILASHGPTQSFAWGVQGSGDHDANIAELLDRVV